MVKLLTFQENKTRDFSVPRSVQYLVNFYLDTSLVSLANNACVSEVSAPVYFSYIY